MILCAQIGYETKTAGTRSQLEVFCRGYAEFLKQSFPSPIWEALVNDLFQHFANQDKSILGKFADYSRETWYSFSKRNNNGLYSAIALPLEPVVPLQRHIDICCKTRGLRINANSLFLKIAKNLLLHGGPGSAFPCAHPVFTPHLLPLEQKYGERLGTAVANLDRVLGKEGLRSMSVAELLGSITFGMKIPRDSLLVSVKSVCKTKNGNEYLGLRSTAPTAATLECCAASEPVNDHYSAATIIFVSVCANAEADYIYHYKQK